MVLPCISGGKTGGGPKQNKRRSRRANRALRSRQRRTGMAAERLEPRAMLAVTSGIDGAELVINLTEANDTALLQVEGGSYAVRQGSQTVGTYSVAAVDAIRIVGDVALEGQAVYVKPGGTITDPLTIDAGVESAVIHAPIVTAGSVTIESPAITLSENVSSSGSQTYSGLLRLANDIVLDAGAGEIRFGSEIRSTVGTRATILENLGNPFRLAVSPDGQTLYASDAVSNYVYFIDLAAEQLDTVDLGKSVANIAVSPDGRRLYVANSLDGSVSVVDTTTRGILATIGVVGTPEGMAFSPDGQTLYVANYSDDSVAVISTATNRMTRSIPVAGSPTAVAVGPDGRLWVASEVLNRVTVIDTAAADAASTIPVGRGPGGITIAADGSRVYVANNFDNSVSVIETATESVVATIGVGSGPTEVVVTPDGRLVYAVNGFSDSVSVIDATELSVATTAPVGSLPVGIVLTADGATAYVANLSSLTELGNDARGLTVRTTGTVRFEAADATVDPLRELIVEAGQQIGPPGGLVTLESTGAVSLAVNDAGYLQADGAVIQFGGNPVHYQGMIDQGWTAVAADVIEGVNTLVFQQNGTGVLHFWRLSDSWVQQESYGWQQPGSAEAYASEVAFGMDFDADGFLGGPPLAVESAGSTTLGRNAAGEYFAGSGGSWTPIIYEGFPLSDATFPGFLTPVAAERVDGTNQVLFRNPGGPLITFSFNDSWAYTATNDWANPGTADYYALETGFGIDVDSDGTIGQPAPPPAIATPDIDFNGNGLTDVIWQGPDNVVVVHIDGDQAQARVLGGGGGWSLAATGDFNGDGVTDVIWRNDPVGSHYLWVLQDFTPVAQTQLAVAPGRALEATGDYNGDGTTDLIWRNTANGRNNMWLMNGTEILGKQSIGGDTDWRLVATGERFDANDDGRTDLIWRSSVSGVSTLWLLAANGMPEQTRFLGGNGIWSIVNTGDFDGDGHGDVLWREGTSGVVVMHRLVDGYLQSATVLGGNLEWSVSGTLDADSDGKSDVYWRNLAGIVVRHLMDGGSVRNSAIVGGNDVWRMLGRPGQQL
jgi:YVTN family beta-propeller protein